MNNYICPYTLVLFLILGPGHFVFAESADTTAKINEKGAAPIAEWLSACTGQKKYSGQPITVRFAETELGRVMAFFAELGNFTTVYTTDICGRVDLEKKETPWDKLLDDIIASYNLTIQCNENNMVIAQQSFPCIEPMTSELLSSSLVTTIPADAVVTLIRRPCYGTCPVYRLDIFGDGKVVFDGQEHTAVSGKVERSVPEDQAREVFALLNKWNFCGFKDQYVDEADGCSIATDLPGTVIKIRIHQYEKVVYFSYGCMGLEVIGTLIVLEENIISAAGIEELIHSGTE